MFHLINWLTSKKRSSVQEALLLLLQRASHVGAAVYAGQLIEEGRIGKVVQVLGMGPHRLNAPSRPDWFFKHDQYGGILCDIGSHQIEQFLFYTGAKDAEVLAATVGNYSNPEYPELEDFGDCKLMATTARTATSASTGSPRWPHHLGRWS